MYCLDSSFLIDLLRGIPEAITKYDSLKGHNVFTTSVSVFELLSGIATTPKKAADLEELLSGLPIVPLGEKDAREAAAIHKELFSKGTPIEESDMMIAGIARSQGFTVVTRDKDFKRVFGLRVLSY